MYFVSSHYGSRPIVEYIEGLSPGRQDVSFFVLMEPQPENCRAVDIADW